MQRTDWKCADDGEFAYPILNRRSSDVASSLSRVWGASKGRKGEMKTLEGVYTEVVWFKFTEMPIDGIMPVGFWEWVG